MKTWDDGAKLEAMIRLTEAALQGLCRVDAYARENATMLGQRAVDIAAAAVAAIGNHGSDQPQPSRWTRR